MCWIFAYKWNKIATDILLNGLKRLEYRGYDSAWIAVISPSGEIALKKATGKVWNLSGKILQSRQENKDSLFHSANLWIAHTRRATHWKPSKINTHPHYDSNQDFFVTHNGIIENYTELKKELQNDWYNFYSDTDTEVIPALLAKYWDGNFLKTVKKVLKRLHGAYALTIISTACPNELIAVKWGSPLVFGYNEDSSDFYIASDIQALSGYVNQYSSLHDGDLVYIKWDTYQIQSEWKITNKALQNLDIQSLETSK